MGCSGCKKDVKISHWIEFRWGDKSVRCDLCAGCQMKRENNQLTPLESLSPQLAFLILARITTGVYQ